MIGPGPNTKIYVYTGVIDFRKGIDGLCGTCKYELHQDPFCGAMFVFSSKNKKSLKILYYDGQGFWIYQKRLSEGRFRWWPQGELVVNLAVKDLSVLIWNGNPATANMQGDWRSIQ